MTDIKMSNTFDLPVSDGEFTLVAMSKHTYISMDRAAVIAINSYDSNQERIAELEEAISAALYGSILDVHGNRDEDGLTRFPDKPRIIKNLTVALKEQGK